MKGPLVVTVCCESICDDLGRVRILGAYLEQNPDEILGLWGVTYPEDADDT